MEVEEPLIPKWPRGHPCFGAAALLQSVTKDGSSSEEAGSLDA